jgi:hypothetical protein
MNCNKIISDLYFQSPGNSGLPLLYCRLAQFLRIGAAGLVLQPDIL